MLLMPSGPAQAAVIPTGTAVELMVLVEVNTRISAPGSPVRLRLNKPVVVDGAVVLPAGTPAFGRVEALAKSGIALSRGTLTVRLTHLDFEGRSIPLADDLMVVRAKGGKSDDAAKILLAPFYAPFSPGNSAKLRAGELVQGHIAEVSEVATVNKPDDLAGLDY